MKSAANFSIIIISILISSFTYPQQLPEETSKVLVRFNEPMSREGIFDISNYKVIDENNNELKIYKVGVVEGDTAVVLFTENHLKGKIYKVIVSNLKDKAGNLISQENNFARYQKPE
ncbi:MAG: Ig-like domain-containing protein [Ignavibacterium sp.]|jgi:hypothetical protein|uniref:SbsA Ig-like domain-containing protein n=1 Tax=Ignavibacterium album TaxID=591197 RepID=A0A7V2ZK04_9BACT|nr:Ig-like domain-containing protein [Ignavibacterium album]MCA2005630.1 Ig-like domain-containing protein [Ignavibacterium sp.]MCX8105426.1 Ig-like domain-containing protein [Ignavibacterium album]